VSRRSSADPRTGVAVLGSTGSIGRQTLDVLGRLTATHRVVALAAGRNADLLAEQARSHHPAVVALTEPTPTRTLDLPIGTKFVSGPDSLEALAARDDVDLVVVGTGGVVSLRPVLAALEAGKVVATANKETLVAGGHLVMPLARRRAAEIAAATPAAALASALGWLRPIDSEHSAIWQCLVGERASQVSRFTLTASGGPFLDEPADLESVTPEHALAHPTWRMGAKVTIDSATLANKGLEVIEAHWLYDAAYEDIDVLIHPQSVVHSAVTFVDGSLKAQLGIPDMHIPIQYAITHPDRAPSPTSAVDLAEIGRLTFRQPDEARFPALRIAREAGRSGPWASAALIAADDVAVDHFLAGRLSFTGIARLLEEAVDRFARPGSPDPGIDDLEALEGEVRSRFQTRPVVAR
jgi:1-deoxy-D-xylulose-5-phosphate reductoisomerase